MTIIIGTEGEQSQKITQKDVSRKHASITVDDEMNIILEDLDSTNGTFVDGHKIIRKCINLNTQIRLGGKCTFTAKQILPVFIQESIQTKLNTRIKQDFGNLEAIWNEYSEQRRAILKEGNKASWMSRLPYLLTIMSGVVTRLLSGNMVILGAVLVGTFILSAISVRYLDKKNEAKKNAMNKELEDLDTKLKESYLCPNPNCRAFLGMLPFGSLHSTGHCSRCRCKWS